MAAPVLKTSSGSLIRLVILLVLLTPLWLYIAWLLTEKRKLVVAIVDKTVLNKKGQEHVSINWILNQEKFTKNRKELYNREKDYYGFFPLDDQKFQIKGLERFNNSRLEQLSKDVDLVYLTDTYGIYKNEWYHENTDTTVAGILYGGMSQQDLYFIKQMQARHKLIITEFNCLATPTDPAVRTSFEKTFGIRWTKWIGRYFPSLDTINNPDLPRWLTALYRKKHNGNWPFRKSGIALVNTDDHVLILENNTHLKQDLPLIISGKEEQRYYGLPASIPYSFWFDVIVPDSSRNRVVSSFQIDVNEAGKKLLAAHGLRSNFPAITAHVGSDYRFFYFSADFSDNPLSLSSSYFKKIAWFKMFLYNRRDPLDRSSFFWNVYQPMVTRILNDYYQTLPRN